MFALYPKGVSSLKRVSNNSSIMSVVVGTISFFSYLSRPGRVAQSAARLTHETEVPGSIPGPVRQSSRNFTGAFFILFFHNLEPQNAGLVDDKRDLH